MNRIRKLIAFSLFTKITSYWTFLTIIIWTPPVNNQYKPVSTNFVCSIAELLGCGMVNRIVKASIGLLLIASPFVYAGPSGSGGGGPEAGDFVSSARLIEKTLRQDPELTFRQFQVPDLADRLAAAIEDTNVVCADANRLKQMRTAFEKAHFDRDQNSIFLDCERYALLESMGPRKYVVVFHEYMRKANLEGSAYEFSSRLLSFPIAIRGDHRRAIDAFCEGGFKDRFQLETYIEQMVQEKSLDNDSARMLREARQNNIHFPDANARRIATYLGWNKHNQYPWTVDLICSDRNRLSDTGFDDDTMNGESILRLNDGSGAMIRIGKSYRIRKGLAAVLIQNGKAVAHVDEYQPYCGLAHDTEPHQDTTISAHIVQSGNIEAFSVPASKGLPATSHINFSITGDTQLTDVEVSMPGDIDSIARMRSVLESCGIKINLKSLIPRLTR